MEDVEDLERREAPEVAGPDKPMRRRGRANRVGRAIGDAGLTIGMARGVTHGPGGGGKSQLDARAALFDEGAQDYERRTQNAGLLERVPGWLVLLVVLLILAAVLLFTSWQR